MNPGVELLKEMDPKKVEAWDRLHDKRKVFRCDRCGAEWKCEYGANTFGRSHEPNGDPDIICQCCGFPTVKEVVMRKRNGIHDFLDAEDSYEFPDPDER